MPTWRSTFPGREALDTKFWLSLVDPAKAVQRRLAARGTLFRQGDAPAAIYVVREGRVRLVRHLNDGSAMALHVAQANETVAEAALFADTYHCDAVAETPSEVAVLPKADLLAALEADPRASLALAKGLAAQVRDLRAQLELRSIRSAPERILFWLRQRASGTPPAVRVDRPWTEIAAEIGLTHEAIYRALAALERAGLVRRRPGQIALRSPAGGRRRPR
jgi:CRP-like cAMP-binding protein